MKKHTILIVVLVAAALYLYFNYSSMGPTVSQTGTVYGPSLAQLTGTQGTV